MTLSISGFIVTMRELRNALRQCRSVRDVQQVRKMARPVPSQSSRFNPARWAQKIGKRERELRACP